jgi:hypothetical protein
MVWPPFNWLSMSLRLDTIQMADAPVLQAQIPQSCAGGDDRSTNAPLRLCVAR